MRDPKADPKIKQPSTSNQKERIMKNKNYIYIFTVAYLIDQIKELVPYMLSDTESAGTLQGTKIAKHKPNKSIYRRMNYGIRKINSKKWLKIKKREAHSEIPTAENKEGLCIKWHDDVKAERERRGGTCKGVKNATFHG